VNLVKVTVRNASEAGKDDVDVVRQPRDAEDNDDERDDAADLGRPLRDIIGL